VQNLREKLAFRFKFGSTSNQANTFKILEISHLSKTRPVTNACRDEEDGGRAHSPLFRPRQERVGGGSFTAPPPERAGAGGSGAEEAGTQVVGPPKSTDHRLQVAPVY
jgi:hypothetical protein